MTRSSFRSALIVGVAMACLAPGPVFAQTSAQLAERVRQLEATLAEVQGQLAQIQAAEQTQRDDIVLLQQAPAPAAAPQQPAEGFRVGATTFRMGGYIKAEGLYSSYTDGDIESGTGRDFFVPAQIPIASDASNEEDNALDMHAKQTRLTFTATRAVEGHTLQGYIEADFQSSPGTGTENVTNAYNLAVRRATITYDRWLFGQDWTTFQNVNTLPETTDFIGPSDGTVFARQALVRYTQPLGQHWTLAVSAENPETTAMTSSSATISSFDDDSAPDIIARLNWTPGHNQFSLAAIARQLSVQTASVDDQASGWGVSASGRVMVGEHDDVRFMLTRGEGIGRYLGIGFASDLVINGAEIETIGETGGFVAYRHVWTPRLRSTLMYSFLNVDNESSVTPALANDASTSIAGNLFFSPIPGLDLGIEYRHAEREVFSGESGDMDRIHVIAKQSF